MNYRNTGQVRNITNKVSNSGYAHVHLYKNCAVKDFTIHRLVATHFLDNPNNLPIINHKDEKQLNNNVENIEWCDHSYNTLYSLRRRGARGKGNPYKQTPKIEQRTFDGSLVNIWDSFIQIKYKLNKNESSVRDCCSGKRKQAYGYLWGFALADTTPEKV